MRDLAVIFDCDGVLVDSEAIGCQATTGVLVAHGVQTSLGEIQEKMMGKSIKEILDYFARRDGIELDPLVISKEAEAYYFRHAQELRPMPGVNGLLEKFWARRMPLAVASSGGHAKIEFSLEKTGLRRYFKVICGTADVARGKPEPDLFLFAAARLGKKPTDCVVIEDSINGVMAGKKAGMFTIGYTSSFSAVRLAAAGADRVVSDFTELADLVDESGQGHQAMLTIFPENIR